MHRRATEQLDQHSLLSARIRCSHHSSLRHNDCHSSASFKAFPVFPKQKTRAPQWQNPQSEILFCRYYWCYLIKGAAHPKIKSTHFFSHLYCAFYPSRSIYFSYVSCPVWEISPFFLTTEQDGIRLVALKEKNSTVMSLYRNPYLVIHNNPQTLLWAVS